MLKILLTDVHPNLQSSDLSEASYLYQVKLLTEVLDIEINFVCYQSLFFLLAACNVCPNSVFREPVVPYSPQITLAS